MKNNNFRPSSIVHLLLSLVFIILILNGCGKVEIRNSWTKGKNIMCFGDSLPFGYGAKAGGDYPTTLASLTKIPVINAGVNGDTTYQALDRFEADVLSKDPCLVIVEFGANLREDNSGRDLLSRGKKSRSFS